MVVLTYPCETAGLLLARLRCEGFAVSAVLLQRRNPAKRLQELVGAVGVRRTSSLAWEKLRAAFSRQTSEPWRNDDLYVSHAGQLVVVPRLNHPSCRDALLALRPDVAVIGGAGILRPDIFQVPRLGTLNVHPGILPQYRGLSSICWAVLDGGEIGATVHFVDGGIDTGPIVARRLVDVRSGDTLCLLRRKVVDAGLDLLTDALDALARGETLVTANQRREEGRCYPMASASLWRKAEGRLAALAKETTPDTG